VYFPYAWANEAVVLPDSDAEEIRGSIYAADDFAKAFQFWCVLIGVGALGLLVVLQAEDALHQLSSNRISGWSQSLSSIGSGAYPINPNPNFINANPNFNNVNKLMKQGWGSEPLLSPIGHSNSSNNMVHLGQQQQQWATPMGPMGPPHKAGFSFSS